MKKRIRYHDFIENVYIDDDDDKTWKKRNHLLKYSSESYESDESDESYEESKSYDSDEDENAKVCKNMNFM